MRNKAIVRLALCGWVGLLNLVVGLADGACAVGKTYQIGIVLPGDTWVSSVEGLKDGMIKLGYAEGKEIVYRLDNAKGDKIRVVEATKKFVGEKVDVIYTITNTALKEVAQIARPSMRPVVFGSASGPVESGIVPGYASRDTNITGVTSGSIELVAKRLEILKELLPRAKRIALIGDIDSDSSAAAFNVAAKIAPKLALQLLELKAKSGPHAVELAKKITSREADALFVIPSLYAVGAIADIAQHAKAARLPFAVYQVEHVKRNGSLFSYGSSYYLQGKQAASLVDKILKGTPVNQLPIETPHLHELILNLDTAREIGVKFPLEMINRADEVIGEAGKRP